GKSWTAVFIAAAILNIVAAVMALTLLKPMRARTIAGLPPLPGSTVKLFASPVPFVVLYLVFMAPLYITTWFDAELAASASSVFGLSPVLWLHIACWLLLIIVAFMRGAAVGYGWLVALAILGAFFDLVPGMNW